jgi:hypothetical protein
MLMRDASSAGILAAPPFSVTAGDVKMDAVRAGDDDKDDNAAVGHKGDTKDNEISATDPPLLLLVFLRNPSTVVVLRLL